MTMIESFVKERNEALFSLDKMIIGICLVVFIIAGLIFLKIREKKNK